MEERIKKIIEENSGVTGVIIRDSSGKMITINEEVVFPSASIIKLFILMALNKDEYNKKIELKKEDKHYIAFDYIVDNQDIRNKYSLLKLFARKSDGQIIILDMICFEYLVLAF